MARVRLPRVGFSAEAAHNPPLPQARGPHLSPFLIPVCSSTPVILPGLYELCQPERVFQDPRKNEGLMEAQFFWGEVEEEELEKEEVEQVEEGNAASFSSSLLVWGTLEEVAAAATASLPQSPLGVCPSPTAMAATPGSQYEDYEFIRQDEVPSTLCDQEDTRSSLQDALWVKKNELGQFLLSRYLAKEPITEAEVLNSVLKDYQDHLLAVLDQASEYLQLVFGLEVKEVGPSKHTYILVPTLGLTLNDMLRKGQRLPMAGILVVILCLTAVEDNCAPEEQVCGELSKMGVCPGREHFIYG